MTEEKSAAVTALTYGDIILITNYSDENLIVFSDGIVKSQLYLKDFENSSSKKSFYRSLFQIYPSFLNTHKMEALAIREAGAKVGEDQKEKEKLEELKEKLTFEYKFNLEHFEKVKNTPITYENPIQFLHIASNKFLACHFAEAEMEKENYKLELVDIPSEATNFKISPSYKHQKENEGYIYYKDLVYIVCGANYLNKTAYLHCSYQQENMNTVPRQEVVALSRERSMSPDSPSNMKTSAKKAGINFQFPMNFSQFKRGAESPEMRMAQKKSKKEVNVSFSKCRWKINLFTHEVDKKFLSYGDIIWMNHAEHNASMIARKDKNGEVDFVQTIISDTFQQYIGNTNGMWIIEHQNQTCGGLVKWEDEFRLKHFSSGKYLSMDYNHPKKRHILKLETEKTDNSLFQFDLMPTLMTEQLPLYYKYVSKEAFTRIKSPSAKLWLHVEMTGDRMEASLLQDVIDDDIFKLFKANTNEIWETSFLISCFPILQNYLGVLEETAGNALSVDDQATYQKVEKRAKEAQECLIQLELFCTNRLLNTSPDQKYGEVNPYRQKVLREQCFLEALGEILKFSFTMNQIEEYLTEKESQERLKQRKGFNFQKLVKKAKNVATRGNNYYLMEQKITICRLIYKLLKSICKENLENELHAYEIIDEFQYHAKYLEEAVDCFISIISANEAILSKLGEEIKIQNLVDQVLQPNAPALNNKKKIQIFNNISWSFGGQDPSEFEPQNFMLYFLKLINATPVSKRNINYLRFLKSICICNGKGVTINQEHLYKVFVACPSLEKAAFMETKVQQNDLIIQVDEKNEVALRECFKKNELLIQKGANYFIEQIAFCSTLLEGRNYLWKTKLERQFPMNFVFEQIYNEDLSLDIRSVFCDLALTLYIDQEPLNPRIVPNLCRVFNKMKAKEGTLVASETISNEKKLAQISKENFAKLLENVMKIVEDQNKKILDDLREKCENLSENKQEKVKVENFLNNVVLAKLIKLLSNMASFDLFRLLNGNTSYFQIVHDLVHILEFDKNYPAISYALAKIRDANYKKNLQDTGAKSKMLNMFGDITGMIGDFSKEIMGTMKNVASSMFGSGAKKSRGVGEALAEEGDDALFFSNPIMKGLILLKHQLNQLTSDKESRENDNEIMIKGEICDMFDFLLDIRQDFLLSNLVSWYENILGRLRAKSDDADNLLKELVDREVASILPQISRTGLADVDIKYKPKDDADLFDNLKSLGKNIGNLKNIGKKKQVPKLEKFVKYTPEDDVPDLDTLFTGLKDSAKGFSKEILPSLLVTFYLTTDTQLEIKLLTLIMRIFGQREEIGQNAQNLEVVFEQKDVKAYHQIENWIENLRIQAQKSEVREIWLHDFVQTHGKKEDDLDDVITHLQSVIDVITNNSETEGSEKYSRSRQNMMRSLSGHSPMIGLIRDGNFHLKTALEDQAFPKSKLKKLLELFSLAHSCLEAFCSNNSMNQKILAENMKLFLSSLHIDMGQVPLICEICKDNKIICETSADMIISSVIDAIVKYGHKASFLEPLTAIQKHKNSFLVENHIKILNKFITASRALEENELQALYATLNQDTKEIELVFQKPLPLDEPFFYHSKLFDVLMFDCQGNESLTFTHSRLRKVFTVPCCFKLIQFINTSSEFDFITETQSLQNIQMKGSKHDLSLEKQHSNNGKAFRKLKPKVIQLMDQLYLKGDKLFAEEFLEHLDLFVEFVKYEKGILEQLTEDFRPSQEFTDYLFGKLLRFVKDYVEKLIMGSNDDVRERRDSLAILELVDIVYAKFPNLSLKVNKEQAQTFKTLSKHYVDENNIVNTQVPDIIDSILRSKDPEYGEGAPRSAVALDQDKQKLPEAKGHMIKDSTYWQDFIGYILDSKILFEGITNERAALSEAIWNFHKIFPPEDQKKYKIEVEGKDIIRKLIVFLGEGQKNKADQDTMIATLRVLRQIIDSAPNKTEMQNSFDRLDATRMLLSVLSDPKHTIMEDRLLNEFLEFGISLLDGGNQNVQKTIYNFCTVYSKSQVMFAKFHSIIYDQIYYLQAKADLKTEPGKTMELEQAHGLKSIILEKLLRFLQLFTEGHYEELQDYLRYQTNSRNRYNLVEAVIELLKTYSSDLVQNNYDNIVKCIDTLNEFVQGPCQENQIALVDGKFFEIVLAIMNKEIKTQKINKNRRKSKLEPSKKTNTYFISSYSQHTINIGKQNRELEPWMLARLKYKVLILVNSLLERSSRSVVKRVMRSLPLEVLKKNLIKIFKKYKDLYGMEYVMDSLKHFDGDPMDAEDPKPPGYYELIIESGFLIYFLMCSYKEIDSLQNEMEELKENGGNSLQDKFKSSLVGQLGTFGFTFVKSVLETVKDVKDAVEKKYMKKKKDEIKENEEQKRIRKSLERKQLTKEAMLFFEQNSASIEFFRLGQVERVPFMMIPYCHYLPKEIKEQFNEEVNRQNTKTKVEGLVKQSDIIIEVCKHELKLKLFFNRQKMIAIFANFVNLWKDLAFFLSLTLNVLILSSYSDYYGDPGDANGGRLTDPELFLLDSVSTESTISIFLGCGIAMAFCSVFVVLFFLLKRAPLIIKKAWEEKSIISKVLKMIIYSFKSVEVVYYITYGALAIIGTTVHPFFFAFHLTEILFRYPTLKNIIKSIWIPKKQLGLAFLLYFVLTYFFSLYAYAYLDDLYQGDCESTILCFKTTYDGTFKANGGIGGYMKGRERGEFRTERFIFDNLANIILLIIMVNIVSGIIIDTFGLLREQEEEKIADIEEKCFICGLDRDVFDRQADTNYNFHIHIKNEHYLWNYVFFIAYLREKDETEYTGIESYISDKIKNNELNWFPFNRALALKHNDEAEHENKKEAFNQFQAEADEINKSIKALTDFHGILSNKLGQN